MDRRDYSLGTMRHLSTKLFVAGIVLTVVGILLIYTLIGAPLGIPVMFIGIVLGLYGWLKG